MVVVVLKGLFRKVQVAHNPHIRVPTRLQSDVDLYGSTLSMLPPSGPPRPHLHNNNHLPNGLPLEEQEPSIDILRGTIGIVGNLSGHDLAG